MCLVCWLPHLSLNSHFWKVWLWRIAPASWKELRTPGGFQAPYTRLSKSSIFYPICFERTQCFSWSRCLPSALSGDCYGGAVAQSLLVQEERKRDTLLVQVHVRELWLCSSPYVSPGRGCNKEMSFFFNISFLQIKYKMLMKMKNKMYGKRKSSPETPSSGSPLLHQVQRYTCTGQHSGSQIPPPTPCAKNM